LQQIHEDALTALNSYCRRDADELGEVDDKSGNFSEVLPWRGWKYGQWQGKLRLLPDSFRREDSRVEGGNMKIRNLILGAIALVVLAGTVVVPANAAVHHRHRRHHHRHHRR
jgi:hypothetical protein